MNFKTAKVQKIFERSEVYNEEKSKRVKSKRVREEESKRKILFYSFPLFLEPQLS